MSIDVALLEEDFSGGELEEEGAAPAPAPAPARALAPAPFPYYPYPEAYIRAWVDLAARRAAAEPAAPVPVHGCGGRRGRRNYRANVSTQS